MNAFKRDLVLPPNLVSLGRIVFILAAAGLVIFGYPIPALILGIPAGLTDYLDGYLARKNNQVTEMGALLDLLADVLFALVCFMVAMHFAVWPMYLMLLWGIRDMSIMAVRASAAQQGFKIPSTFISKLAANFNSYAFMLMGLDVAHLFSGWLHDGVHWLGLFGIHAGIAMQWITGFGYIKGYAERYRGKA